MRSITEYVTNNQYKIIVILCHDYKEVDFIRNEILENLQFDLLTHRQKLFIKTKTGSQIRFVSLRSVDCQLRGVSFNYLLIAKSIHERDNFNTTEKLDEVKMHAHIHGAKIGTYVTQYDLDHWDAINKKWEDHVNE